MKVFSLTLILFIFACQPKNQLELDFDGEEIMELIEKQLSFGQRLNNSSAKKKCEQWLEKSAQKYGYNVKIDRWQESVEEQKRNFANIIAIKKGSEKSKDFIIVGSHYDTKKILSQPKFSGANDGASSTAAVIAIMKKLAKWKNKKTIHFVFFDGEECFGHNSNYRRPYQGSLNGLHGSSRYAKQLLYNNSIKNCRAMLMMDMIGDKNLKISFPRNNSNKLINKALSLVKQEKLQSYFSTSQLSILDDHAPFEELGIATLNFIDFQYGKNNKFWHTDEDTVNKLSSQSLAIVSHIFTKLLKELDK